MGGLADGLKVLKEEALEKLDTDTLEAMKTSAEKAIVVMDENLAEIKSGVDRIGRVLDSRS